MLQKREFEKVKTLDYRPYSAVKIESNSVASKGIYLRTNTISNLEKISKIEEDADGKKSYTLLFEDGFEMIGLMEKDIIVAC